MTAPSGMKTAQKLRDTLDALATLRPSPPRVTWTEPELAALEGELGVRLHDDARAYLLVVGEGPGFWSGQAKRVRELDATRRAALARPFPLEKGWVDPSLLEELTAARLAKKYAPWLYPLPAGTSVDDGVVPLGGTSDGRIYLLVVNGASGGTVWTDNRGNDYCEVLPEGRLLTLLQKWASARLAEAQQERAIEQACPARDFAALREAFGDETLKTFFARARRQVARGALVSPDVAWCMAAREAHCEDPEAAGQALVVAGEWQHLEAASLDALARLDAGALPRTRQAELTFKTHLAIASVKLGKPFTTTWPDAFHEYYHYDTAFLPMTLSRWDTAALRALFALLRVDQPFWLLAQLPAEALAPHVGLVVELVEAARPQLEAGRAPGAQLVAGAASDLLERLGALPPSAVVTDATHALEALAA